MDAHERFMAHRTTEACLLLDLASNKTNVLTQLIGGFIGDIQVPPHTLTYLETIRTVLCSFYQQMENSRNNEDLTKALPYENYRQRFAKINVSEVQEALYTYTVDAETLSLVLDILILQMTLYHDVPSIVCNWEALQDSIYQHLDKNNDINILDVQLLHCYMDSIFLYQRSHGSIKLLHLEIVAASFLLNMGLWLRLKDRKKYLLLSLVLPKLIKMINNSEITRQTWDLIFLLEADPGNVLTMLCLTADVWFPMDTEYNEQLIKQTTEEPLWWLLLKGLSSSVPQRRKEALYLIKRIVDFTDKHTSGGIELCEYNHIRPLICTGDNALQILFKKNLNNYILTLEALEEKQKHLVTPVFPLLKALLDETYDKENCQSGLHIAWIRCAFTLMLQHDNNAIVKWGLQNVLTLDPELYDDEFLSKVIDVLNRTWLYENDVNDEEPPVVKELARLLNNAEATNSDLVTRFMVKASEMTWGPVALFYVIHALSMVRKVCSFWQEAELEAVKSLAEINLTMHCRILRIGSQIELLETITHFVTESSDLVAVANTLAAFSTSEALIRGQLAWKRTSAWLSKIVTKDEALGFVEKICGQMMNDAGCRELSVESFSLMIMLFHDGRIILNSKSCPGLSALHNLLHCLIGADSRPYANAELRNRSIQLMYHLMDFTSPKDCILRELISNYADASLRYTFKNLRKISDDAYVDNINMYVLITQQLFTAEDSVISKRDILNHIERFEIESWNIIQDGEDSNSGQRFFGIKILHACLKAASAKLRNYHFIGPLYNTYKTLMNQSSGSTEKEIKNRNENRKPKGKIAAEYYKYVAELFHEYVKDESADEWIPDINWIEQVSYLIQVGGKDIFLPLVGILSQIFYKCAVKSTDIDNFKSTVRLCWNSTLESNECRLVTEEMIDLMFSSPFLECKETRELTIECTWEMVDKADKIPGLSIILLKGLKQVKGEYLSNFYEVIRACLLHGTVPRRDQKIELQARSYVLDCYQEVYPNYLSNMNVNTTAATRAHAVTLLHKMITDDPAHGVQLLPLFATQLNESQNKRYFGDSQMHRLKNRIMQVLLVLQPILEIDDIESLHTLMCNNILSESSQPSVRIMQEWLLVRIYLESETLRGKIWNLIHQAEEKRVGSLCSVVSVVYHVARLLSSDFQLDFIYQAFQYIMPCCMAQQFNVRLYAQVIAFKLYDLAAQLSYSTITEKYSDFYAALSKSLKHGNLMKNSIKLRDDFYFTVFNPIDDYSLQTLFYELPRLSNVSSDEYILPQMFEKFGFKESNSHPLKLLNPNSDMSEAQVSAHILKSNGSAGPIADEIESSADCSSDMQKKFIPWKSMTPNEEILDELSETLTSRRKALSDRDNIILVASLIDKLPNLGGLSRTCEILGVKEFVVASIKQTEDREFQNLSVSAEKMITLTEVKPHQLQQYLLEKRNTGYRLVGAEQTVNSTNLMEMKFDKKTVLLLGNEKAGIPANLIPLLDECVEIPQVGVVRSLNVHVTGAICLWEYFKQHHSS